ncbi:MAG TPA: nitroreductase family protein [Methylomirabilota bacterium]|jgi:nitroreductase|nr:nitroreductase family protein [Methylomirabilota bacterium]
MDVFDCIVSRPAVRNFRPDPLPEEAVKKILHAGRQAHSQRNRQPWRFIVVQDRETLKRIGVLASTGPYIAEAPLAIALVIEGAKNPYIDAARAAECLMLAAWGEGVGSCWVGGLDRPQLKTLLGIPEEAELVTVIPFGYPTAEEKNKKKVRKRLSRIAYRERYGQAF